MAHMRRASSLRNVVAKRNSINAPVNLNCLVRVYLLDGSSKVLQMFSNSTAKEVLIALKFNLDLSDISTFALFRVVGNNVRRVELNEVITDVMKDPTNSGQEVRLLFRSWISFKYGAFDHEVFQHGIRNKQPNTAMWLAFMEAVFMCMTGKFYLTEDEAVMLGCLKMQAESGDFNPAHHDLRVMKNRVSSRFPEPARSRMKSLLQQAATNPAAAVNAEELAVRVQALYARIAGKSKVEAQINYLESLRTWCPFYGSTLYEVQCQYDDNPLDPNSSPPVIGMNAWVGPLAIFLLTPTEPPVIMRHPYRRIIKWVTLPDKHIFTYWVIKPHVTLADLEEFQEQQRAKLRGTRGRGHSGDGDSDGGSDADGDGDGDDDDVGQLGELDAQQFCDCVYLVTSQVKELDYLVKSYVEASTGTPPVLPGATDDLLPMKVAAFGRSSRAKSTAASSNDDDDDHHGGNSDEEGGVHDDSNSDGDSSDGGNGGGRRAKAAKTKKAAGGTVAPPIPTAETAQKPRVGRLSLFFSSLGGDGLGQTGSGLGGSGGDGGGEEHFGDDTAAVTNSWFRNMYKADAPTKKGGGGTHGTGSGGGQHRRGSAVLADDAKPDEISVHNIPMGVKYAASMSELKRMAEESQFSDEEDEEGEDDEDDDDGDDDEDNGGGRRGKKATGRRARGGDSDEDGDNDDEEDDDDGSDNGQRTATRRIPGISSSNAFRRASKILFG